MILGGVKVVVHAYLLVGVAGRTVGWTCRWMDRQNKNSMDYTE